jgi:hypothetical protein
MVGSIIVAVLAWAIIPGMLQATNGAHLLSRVHSCAAMSVNFYIPACFCRIRLARVCIFVCAPALFVLQYCLLNGAREPSLPPRKTQPRGGIARARHCPHLLENVLFRCTISIPMAFYIQ